MDATVPVVSNGTHAHALYRVLNIVELGDDVGVSGLLAPDMFQCSDVHDIEEAFVLLTQSAYDLLLLDDNLLGDDIYIVIMELKRNYPLLPMIVFTDSLALPYQSNIIDAGADDVLMKDTSAVEVNRRIRLSLRLSDRTRHRFKKENELFEITMLTRQLHAQTLSQELIETAIKLVCSTYSLYGFAINLLENGVLRIHSGCRLSESSGDIRYTHSLREPSSKDPLIRPMYTDVIEIFDDITKDNFFIPIPNLPKAQSALVIPLRQYTDNLGTIVLFGQAGYHFETDDLSVYEILATQVAVALQNANFHQAQHQQGQVNQMLLDAWQLLLEQATARDISQTLCSLIERLPNVEHSVVWLVGETFDQTTIYMANELPGVRETFIDLLKQSSINDFIERTRQESGMIMPTTLRPGDNLRPLYRALQARQLLFLPLEDSARLIGGIVISIASDKQFGLHDIHLVRNLSIAAGQALERIMLIEEMVNKSARLEAILRSVTEGIFFVDDSESVAFCNPQVMEIIGVKPSDVLEQRWTVLIDLLAAQATDTETVRNHLYAGVNSLSKNAASRGENYPIIEFNSVETGHSVRVELVSMEDTQDAKRGWVGLVHYVHSASPSLPTTSDALKFLLSTLMTSSKQLAHALSAPTSGATPRAKINELRRRANAMVELIEQFTNFWEVDTLPANLYSRQVDLAELVETIIRSDYGALALLFDYTPVKDQFVIETDPSAVYHSLRLLLSYAVMHHEYESHAKIGVTLEDDETQLRLCFHLPQPVFPHTEELSPFEIVSLIDPQNIWEDVYPFYALIQLHQCRIWAEPLPEKGQRLILSFSKSLPAQVGEPEADGAGAPMRNPQTVMVIQGKSILTQKLANYLTEQEFELFIYKSAGEALRDASLTRLDLVVIDGLLERMDSAQVCQRIRKATQAPVVIVADSAADGQRVKGLEAGAEDYLVEPISQNELIAKINVLFKRPHLASRMEPPLELGDLRIDFARRAVYVAHKPVTLTRIEYELLHALARNVGQVLTHQMLLEAVWGPEYRGEKQYLWVHVSRLRKKLEPTAYIHNQQGIGYVLQYDDVS